MRNWKEYIYAQTNLFILGILLYFILYLKRMSYLITHSAGIRFVRCDLKILYHCHIWNYSLAKILHTLFEVYLRFTCVSRFTCLLQWFISYCSQTDRKITLDPHAIFTFYTITIANVTQLCFLKIYLACHNM
jgi:hypothetical protein